VGVIMASLLANCVVAFQEYSFAWRACFLISGLLGSGIYFFRRHQFAKCPIEIKKSRVPHLTTLIHWKPLWEQQRNIVKIFWVCSFSYLTYGIPFILFNGLIPLISAITLEQMMTLNTMFLIVDLFLIPVIGRSIEKYDINRVMLGACFVLVI